MTPKEVVQRFVEYFNRADAGQLAELYAEDAVNHQVANAPVAGRAAIRAMFEREFAAAQMVCLVENIFADGEWAMLEWKDRLGLRGCGFFHVVDGKIVFQRGYWDKLSFLKQHGAPLRPMRRRDREITDPAVRREIVDRNHAAVIAMTDGATPYAVMMNYAPVWKHGAVTLLFHSAPAGRKIDCLRENPAVSVFINDAPAMKIIDAGAQSSHWTTHYRSVVLAGNVRFLERLAEKRQAAEDFMRHYTDSAITLPAAALNATTFFELVPGQISGKQNPGEPVPPATFPRKEAF